AGDDQAVARGDGAQHGEGELAGHEDDAEPLGHAVARDEEDQRAEDEELVRERVEERAEDRLLPALAREVAVEEVGDAAEDEDERGRQRQDAAVVVDEGEDHGQGRDPREGEQVRQVGDLVAAGALLLRLHIGSSRRTVPAPEQATSVSAPASSRGTTFPVQPTSADGVTHTVAPSLISMAMGGRWVRKASVPSPRNWVTE